VANTELQVLCRERATGDWKSQDTAISTEFTLTGQPRCNELEYYIVAVNKADEELMNNSVMKEKMAT